MCEARRVPQAALPILAALLLLLLLPGAPARGTPRPAPSPRVILLVLDGLRPDQVTREGMPRLWSLRAEGTWFSESRTVYPPMTLVAASSLATGAEPGRTGIVGNTMLVEGEPLYLERLDNLRRAQAFFRSRGEGLLLAETLFEALARCGRKSLIVGKGGPAALLGRASGAPYWAGEEGSPEVERALGEGWRERWFGSTPTDDALVERTLTTLVPALEPDLLLVWYDEPDRTEHRFGPDSAEAARARLRADAAAGRVGRFAKSAGALLFVLSDHGMSTVRGDVETARAFPGVRSLRNGGSEYLLPSGATEEAALVERIASMPWAGAIFSRGTHPGAIPLAQIFLEGSRTPPLAFSFGWTATGWVWSTDFRALGRSLYPPGTGMHGSLSPLDLRDVLLATGEGAPSGRVVSTPAGIVDVAPTVARRLGCAPPKDGVGHDLFAPLSRTPPAPRRIWAGEGAIGAPPRNDSGGRRWVDVVEVRGTPYVLGGGPPAP